MNTECFLSFIVPVYNVAPYVEQCIRSLYSQDIPVSTYEVIVVDDCSTDNSKSIVFDLQKEFPSLKLIELKENMKLGSARNIGLDSAVGEYVWFIDSDDYIQSNILNLICTELRNEAVEILHFDYQVFESETNLVIPYRVHYSLDVCTGSQFYFDSNELWWEKGVEAWRKVYKRSFLIDNKLRFAEKVMYEDSDYSLKMFSIAQKVKHIDIAPYFYRKNNLSITNVAITPQHLKYWILLALRCDGLMKNFKSSKDIDLRFISITNEFIKYQILSVITNLKKFRWIEKKEYKQLLKDIDISVIRKYVSIWKYLYVKYVF
jgi:glycosyltransferase involved in cell wall biosynthesis